MNPLSRIHEYIVPDLRVNFIDRDYEAEILFKIVSQPREYSHIIVITGPWGCGKSEFAKALTYALRDLKDFIVIYCNLTEEEVSKAFFTQLDIKHHIIEVVLNILKDFLKIPINFYTLLDYLNRKIRLKGRKCILFIDEITRSLDRYRISIKDYVTSISRKIYDVIDEFNLESFYPVLLTSEQTAVQYFMKELGKNLALYLIWNLSKDSLEELLRKIHCKVDFDILWKISGGNPRVIYEISLIHKWDIKAYISEKIEVCRDIYTYAKDLKVLDFLDEIIQNVDNIKPYVPGEVIPEYRFSARLLEENLVIPVDDRFIKLSNIPHEDWIGKRYAFQIPIYYWILKIMSKEKSIKVNVRRVLEEMSK